MAGATSTVGRALVARLREVGLDVRTLARRHADHPADLTRPATLRGCCEGVDVVYALVGAPLRPFVGRHTSFDAVDRDGNLALLAEAERAGVRRLLYLSVFGDPGRPMVYIDRHRDVERALADSPLSTTAVRPTGFFGSFAPLAGLARAGLVPQLGDGSARTNPIHELDLADLLCALRDDGPATREVGGPEVLTRAAIGARLARGRVLPLPAPTAAARLGARVLRRLDPHGAALLDFLGWALTHDCVAPPYGQRRLGAGDPR